MNRRQFHQVTLGALASAWGPTGRHGFAEQASHDADSGSAAPNSAWFTEGRYGLIVSFSVYALLGRGSWAIYLEQIPVHEYKKLMYRFNPTAFSAKEWVQLVKDAGQKYFTFLAKHRDGFSMFDTKLSDFSIMHSPFGRDICAELADECRRQGITFNIYYQLRDWTHPAYRPSFKRGTPVSQEYIDYFHGQVRELCSNYGKLGALWFDGGIPDHTPEQWRSAELVDMVRKLQPGILINDRTGLPGDFSTPEEGSFHVPGGQAGAFHASSEERLWEWCVTTNDHWGYDAASERCKSPEKIVQLLVSTVAAGGNLLLNAAPDATGRIDAKSAANLRKAGEWIRRNGDSIYGTRYRGPAYYSGVYFTSRGTTLYLHIFDWEPGTTCDFPILGIKSATKVHFLGDEKGLQLKSTVAGLRLVVRNPNTQPSPDTVVVFENVERPSPGSASVPL